MIEGAVYVLNKESHRDSALGWPKLTFIERRVSRMLTFERQREELPPENKYWKPATVTCNEYEWIVFTHSDHGYVTMNEDEFVEELCSGCYELHNWKKLHRDVRACQWSTYS